MPAELWKGFGGDGINETCSQEPHFAVARGDVLLRCKLFSPKISQQPSRQDWWQEATCHLWPATLPSSAALHNPATPVVTTERCQNTACCPEKKTQIGLSYLLFKRIHMKLSRFYTSHTYLIGCRSSVCVYMGGFKMTVIYDHKYLTFGTVHKTAVLFVIKMITPLQPQQLITDVKCNRTSCYCSTKSYN